jgi:L-galactose dehydrogenase/L-glyceraldehyde 3-phosphate reductase
MGETTVWNIAPGKTGLRVSALGFGCGTVGGLIIREEPRTRVRAVARALEAGINYFDTASMYGNGQSEQNLGQVLNELKPDVYVGTKVRIRPEEMGDLRGAIHRSIEASLTRMGREQVDLIQLHNHIVQRRTPGEETETALTSQEVLEEVITAFRQLQADGKVRFYGITGLGETAALREVIDPTLLHTVQVCYNLSTERWLSQPSASRARTLPADRPGHGPGDGLYWHPRVGRRGLSGQDDAIHRSPSVAPIGSGPDYHIDVERARGSRFWLRKATPVT